MERKISNVVQDVKNIDPAARQWLERALGRPLREDEEIFIMAYSPSVPDEDRRRAAHKNLLRILDQAHRNAQAQGITAEEADAVVEEAMDAIRHRKE